MERYADSLGNALRGAAGPDLSLYDFRPSRQRIRHRGRIGRYWSRYARYLVQARRTTFQVNHILDQAYAHLTYALDGRRTIVTCHDIFPLQHWRGLIRGLERRGTPPLTVQFSLSGLQRARFVVTDSQATKDDLIEVLGLPSDRIRVVPPGVDAIFSPSQSLPEPRNEATIVCVSTGGPYKNDRAAVEVLARVVKEADREVRLVRVGTTLAPRDAERAREYRVADRILELGFLSDAALADVYRQADAVLHPSFYEGFGWPPLEAMASGIPVVTSTWSSLVELTGDAALRADAEDYDGLADCVVRTLHDERLRSDLRRRGLVRAQRFSWDRTAGQVLGLYETIVSEGS